MPTPALVVDMAAARRNHRRACADLGPGQVLRPHFKAHKSTTLAKLQLSFGAASVCCQTSWEAIALAQAGIDDIMVTNQILDPTSLSELVSVARRANVSTVVDHAAQVALIEHAANAAGCRIGVLVEIDLGMKRCGVAPQSDDLLSLAAAISASGTLRFLGIQAYDGHVAAIKDPAARRLAAGRSAMATREARDRLVASGFPVPMVAGCATSHLPFVGELEEWTDIQAGSYLLMDGAYAEFADLDYEIGLYALATVIHRSPERAVLDIGLKHLSVDRGSPAWIGDPAAALRLSDEHTVIAIAPEAVLGVGERTYVLPRHIDPTVNLHPALWLVDGARTTRSPVDGRMPLRGPAEA